ncbi:sodium/proline symporter [Sporosarcina sp. P37]|uniref:sodium/proline symporter PutP n=1 Tax=unclassified Sporosarcina TaxID=2647733 RepID=UPI0009BD6DEE|nr:MULTISPECIES: sodium/proline symporter PutP [unclassified Sporosarcina]ARD48074.1 sodium:proline symporter [Sporosarcina sp. P33]ARK24588.1 sodium/proline symporter [Sporosarcina sp. P37]PID19745.1 sodium/proline symporter PutP [Sporosarcina sp. P35]
MTEQTYQLIAIIMYMAAMLFIGWYAFRRTSNLTDYMLGGRSLGPAVTALSAGASDMSGWLLMGLPGAIYLSGLGEAWIAVGLTIGAYLNWLFVAPRLRAYTQVSNNSITIPSFLENRLKDTSRLLRVASGIIILVFFTFYVSSGMVAGGKFFQSSFGLEYHTGLIIVSAVVLAYTLFGGFLAVSYTDFVQGLIMFLALVLVPSAGIIITGGFAETAASIREADPALFNFVSGVSVAGIISSLAWGLGYFGQPHIIVRFMAIKSVKETKSARRIGIGWMLLSLMGAIATALVGIAYFQQNSTELADAETVFIVLGQIIFHPLIAGIMLAAVLAAIMSTISSQLIVTSSALIEDLYKAVFKSNASDRQYVFLGRAAVLFVTIIAMVLAWPNKESVLKLVSFAWAGFGGAFGPIILLSLYWRKLTAKGALFGMVAGAITVGVWGNIKFLSGALYEIVPGFIICLLVAYAVSLATYRRHEVIEGEYDETMKLLEKER